jgi:vacuolar-type H+-ATPase subunit I/STV1
MAQVVVEETIMAVAKWLISLVNRTLETKATAPKPEPTPPANPAEGQVASGDTPPVESEQASAIDQLLAKFSGLLEEACDRTQAIALLESRLQELESIQQSTPDWQESIQTLNQAVVKLDSRLSQVEKLLQQVDLVTISEALTTSLKNESHLQQLAQTSTQQIAELNV